MPAYFFAAMFKKSKVGAAPANAPTVDVIDVATNTLVVSGGTPGTLSNMAGVYTYTYTGAAANLIAMFKTADTTVDSQHVPSYTPQVISDYLDVAVSSRNATTPPTASANATAVRSELATELARVDAAVTTRATPAGAADAVWDEASADHVASGSMGKLLSTAGAASDPLLNLAGSYASDTMGGKIQLIGTNTTVVNSPVVNADISVIYGDDYYIADGRALDLSSTQWVIADITPYTGVVKVTTPTAVLSFPVTITAAKQAYLPLTAVQIATIGVGYHTYDFEVTKISDSHVATLQQGSFAVTPDAR